MARRSLKMGRMATLLAVDGETKYSESVPFHECIGVAAVHLISTAGTVTISQQCSLDNTNWFNPVDASGNALGVVCTNATVTTGKWISYSPVFSPYVRFAITEGSAATLVTLTLHYQEEL